MNKLPFGSKTLIDIEARWKNVEWTLDTTPMMPESMADPAYAGREHRLIASAPSDIAVLLDTIDALTKENKT